MLFNSYTFILFFIIVSVLHYLPLKWKVKKFNLLIASYLFYSAWNPVFVILIWISTIVDWFAAKKIFSTDRKITKISFLLLSLCTNLGLLSFFKYSEFLLDNFIHLLSVFGIQFHPAMPDIVLPVGISFYTFQTLSYTIDIYRNKLEPAGSFLDFALYVTFFPQLVAGPIVRASTFLPQCKWPKKPDLEMIGWGASLFLLGLFQKIVVADGLLAPVADKVYENANIPDTISAWAGTFAFSGQIFCDFAGYSTCAIGVALCLGFVLPDNFKFPYAAIGFADFWKRWHISLSTWLRDYLYIPLGGNRKGTVRTYYNVMATMFLCGLWHGASWTFVAWGCFHGIYLIVERILKKTIPPSVIWEKSPVNILLSLFTFFVVCFTWVFFRSHNFKQAFSMIKSMAGVNGQGLNLLSAYDIITSFTMIALILITHWIMRERSLKEITRSIHWSLRSVIYATVLVLIIFLSGEHHAFIYFQF